VPSGAPHQASGWARCRWVRNWFDARSGAAALRRHRGWNRTAPIGVVLRLIPDHFQRSSGANSSQGFVFVCL